MEQTRTNKKTIAIVAVVACLALAAALGTYAWLTSTGGLTNNFTTAGINQPTKDSEGTDLPSDQPTKLSGNLYESNWVDGSKLAPGTSVAKNPRVGLGKGSEDAYVLVNVANHTASDTATDANTTYFDIDSSWTPVEGTAKTVTTSDGQGEHTHYLSGLFIYIGSSTSGNVSAVNAHGAMVANANNDVWTTELFTQVTTPATATADDFAKTTETSKPTIDVNYYISADAKDTTSNPDGSKDSAIAQAKVKFGYTD